MGKFEAFKGRFLRYKGGEEHVVHGLDADRWSYFEALSILKDEFKYDGMVKLWWKLKRGRMDRDLRPLVTDKDALDLSGYAESRKEEVQIYVEHVVSTAEPIEFIEAVVVDDKGGQDEAVVVDDNGGQDEATANDNGGHGGAATAAVNDNGGHGGAAAAVNDNGGHGGAAVDAHGQAESNVAAVDDGNVAAAAVDDGNVVAAEHEASVAADVDVQSGDDSAVDNGYEVLDESEEELHRDSDDGFGCSDTPRRNITDVLQRWSNMRKSRRKRKHSASASAGGFETPQFGGNHDMDATYSTDELQSDVDCEGEQVHKYPMFKVDDVGRDFKFCLGMEFCSLKEFKQALKEYSVLNGREVIFLKNDDVRVRAICKKKCGFLILCSKVGGSHTFRVKT